MQAIINGEMYEVEPAVAERLFHYRTKLRLAKEYADRLLNLLRELNSEYTPDGISNVELEDLFKRLDELDTLIDELNGGAKTMKQVSENEFYAYIKEYDHYYEYNEELKVKGTTHNEYIDIKENRSDRLLGRISEFLLNYELKYVYEIQEDKNNG